MATHSRDRKSGAEATFILSLTPAQGRARLAPPIWARRGINRKGRAARERAQAGRPEPRNRGRAIGGAVGWIVWILVALLVAAFLAFAPALPSFAQVEDMTTVPDAPQNLTAIVAALIGGRPGWQPWIVTVSPSLLLLTVGGLVLMRSLGQGERGPAPKASSISHDPEADQALMARLDTLLETRKLYLDPDLTLTRLARVLQVPVKRLSAAINRSTGSNVSRYVNGYRIREACHCLEGGASVTEAMLASGFNTKSNFNREFRRVTGKTPSSWRDSDNGE